MIAKNKKKKKEEEDDDDNDNEDNTWIMLTDMRHHSHGV